MKASSATSAKATASRRRTGRSSANNRNPPSRTSAEGFALTGRSDPPNPEFNAFRADLADVALAGRVIASHYAEPLQRKITQPVKLLAEPQADGKELADLVPGEIFDLLDDTLGWAWGYAGTDRRVGYVRSEAIG